MSTQAEAADQIVKIMLDGSEHAIKIAGAGAKQIAILLYALLKDQKRTKGKMCILTVQSLRLTQTSTHGFGRKAQRNQDISCLTESPHCWRKSTKR